jgi:predicted homoserine dehydrogenase-like protein
MQHIPLLILTSKGANRPCSDQCRDGRRRLEFPRALRRHHQPIETCLVGSGGFGRSYLAQARRIRLVNARIAVDVTAEAAGRAFAAAGIAPCEIALCETPAEARAAWAAGRHVAAGRLETVLDLPFAMSGRGDRRP